MDEDRERIIRLEEAVAHGQELAAYQLGELRRRIELLETRPDTLTRVMGPGGWAKLLLAMVLMASALIASGGDFGAALRAMRSGG